MPAAGLSTVSARRRSLVTAAAAGAVLCALWFVPSANAAPDGAGGARGTATAAHAQGAQHVPPGPSAAAVPAGRTGSDGASAVPYALGGAGLAGAAGAVDSIRSPAARRRSRRRGLTQASGPVTDSAARDQLPGPYERLGRRQVGREEAVRAGALDAGRAQRAR